MPTAPRLLDKLRPIAYRLDVSLDWQAFRYQTAETVTFELVEPSAQLTFHASGLENLRVTGNLSRDVIITTDKAQQTVTFTFAQPLQAGTHSLALEFGGVIGESLHGLYRSSYHNAGCTQWLVSTQFEAVHAREAFVCIDEPSAKATFDLSITVPTGLKVLANTPVETVVEAANDYSKHTFKTTPVMSTYLLAFVVGNLEQVQARTRGGVMVRAFATAGKQDQLKFALDTAVRCLDFYDEFFGLPYPLPKLDMVAIPDFAAGAMENWGLVTYRETALLLDENNSSLSNRQRVAEVVAHELAHQWFGNLVTMAWWNDLWLNEGFASWVEVLAQDELFPEWQVWTQFLADHYAHAMDLDGLASTHPIEVEVEDPRALDEIFDAVSYSKGAAVINMLHAYLGAAAFRAGLQSYLQTFAHGNARTNDLWQALEASSGEPVGAIMAHWTNRGGFPIVSASANGGKLRLEQERFYASPRVARARGDAWLLPVGILLADGSTRTVLARDGQTLDIDAKAVVKLNAGQTAFLRVRYDRLAVERLLPSLKDGSLPAIDRFGVVSDTFAAAQAGHISTDVALRAAWALSTETDYTVWQAISHGFGSVRDLADPSMRRRLDTAGVALVRPNIDRLGWELPADEPYFDTLMRPLVLQQAVSFGHQPSVKQARQQFDAHRTGTLAPADLRGAIYHGVAYAGDEQDFDTLLGMYRAEGQPQERMRLLASLCRFRTPPLINRALDLAFSPDVRSQDTIFVLAWCLTNPDGGHLAWQFIQDAWPTLIDRFGEGGHMLEYVPGYVGQAFARSDEADAVEAFFASHPHPAITRPVRQAVETIRIKADWYDRDRTHINEFLDEVGA